MGGRAGELSGIINWPSIFSLFLHLGRAEGRSGRRWRANRLGKRRRRRHLRQTQQSPAIQRQGSVGFDARQPTGDRPLSHRLLAAFQLNFSRFRAG